MKDHRLFSTASPSFSTPIMWQETHWHWHILLSLKLIFSARVSLQAPGATCYTSAAPAKPCLNEASEAQDRRVLCQQLRVAAVGEPRRNTQSLLLQFCPDISPRRGAELTGGQK